MSRINLDWPVERPWGGPTPSSLKLNIQILTCRPDHWPSLWCNSLRFAEHTSLLFQSISPRFVIINCAARRCSCVSWDIISPGVGLPWLLHFRPAVSKVAIFGKFVCFKMLFCFGENKNAEIPHATVILLLLLTLHLGMRPIRPQGGRSLLINQGKWSNSSIIFIFTMNSNEFLLLELPWKCIFDKLGIS